MKKIYILVSAELGNIYLRNSGGTEYNIRTSYVLTLSNVTLVSVDVYINHVGNTFLKHMVTINRLQVSARHF